MNATNYESLVLEVTGKLTDKLGTIAPHAWEVLVRQSYVWAWSCIVTWVLLAALTGVLNWLSWRKWKCDDGDEIEVIIITVRVLVTAAVLGLFIAALTCAPDVATALINPEYRAMMTLIGK